MKLTNPEQSNTWKVETSRLDRQGVAEADHREQVVSEGKAIMPQIQAMMESFVDDPGMRKNIIPNFGAGVKQMTFSDDYLQALNKSNFKLVITPIKNRKIATSCDSY